MLGKEKENGRVKKRKLITYIKIVAIFINLQHWIEAQTLHILGKLSITKPDFYFLDRVSQKS